MPFTIHFAESSNFVTDMILAAVLGLLIKKMYHLEKEGFFIKSWRQYFVLMAITILIGGFGHLLSYYCGVWLKMGSWIMSLIALFVLERNMLKMVVLPTVTRFIPALKLFFFLVLTIITQQFLPTKTGIALGMVFIICPILLYFNFKTENTGYRLIVISILMNGFGGLAHAKNIALADWFNGGDLAHFISAVSFIGMYFGFKQVALNDTKIVEEEFEEQDLELDVKY